MGLTLMYPALLDEFQNYHHPTLAGWNKAIKYIYKAFKWSEYVPARKDCEDFALLFKSLASAYFGFNACVFAIGISPEGIHGYILLRTEKGYYIWEADPSFKWKTPLKLEGQFDYIPQYVLI